jgi:predicted dehydrogenase
MTRRIKLGIVGSDERTAALTERFGPASHFAAGPFELVTGVSRWEELAAESVEAVYVGGAQERRAATVAAALAAGKHVLCPLPVALTTAELAQVEQAWQTGGGVLLTPSDPGATMAGAEALALRAAGVIGGLHAIFCASRSYMPEPGAHADVLDRLGWGALDFVLACADGAAPERLYAAGSRLFGNGGGQDTLLLNLRFPGAMIATVELAHSLPREFSAPLGEFEADLTGETGALRVDPLKVAVSLFSAESGFERRPWHLHPVASMLDSFRAAIISRSLDPALFARNRTLLALMAAIRQSAATHQSLENAGA